MSSDPLSILGGPITRARAKKIGETLNGLIEEIKAKSNAQQGSQNLENRQGLTNCIQAQEEFT